MSLTPTVYPSLDAQGVETSPIITALFDQAIELGSLDSAPIVLVKKETEYLDNQIENVAISAILKRIDLLSPAEVNTLDYGTGANPGIEYRSKIEITPMTPLDENSQYSVIIPKELSLLTVFDVLADGGNTGSSVLAKGVFTGLVADEYEIRITQDGSQSRCYYEWERLSDNYIETGLRARRRFIELEQGLFLMFPDGEYKAGDSFRVKVQPEVRIGELFTWSFSTGAHNHSVPEDQNSGSVVNLPVVGSTTQVGSGAGFIVESIVPEFAESLVAIGAYSTVSVGNLVFKTKDMSAAYNGKLVEVIGGETAGAETLNIVGDTITIGIEETTTTNQDIIDLIGGSALDADLEVTSLLPGSAALLSAAKAFSEGVPRNTIIVTFSQDIDQTSITDDSIKLFADHLLEYTRRELNITHSVLDNVLTIRIED